MQGDPCSPVTRITWGIFFFRGRLGQSTNTEEVRSMVRLEGTYTFEAPREVVWEVLMDPHAIAKALPGT